MKFYPSLQNNSGARVSIVPNISNPLQIKIKINGNSNCTNVISQPFKRSDHLKLRFRYSGNICAKKYFGIMAEKDKDRGFFFSTGNQIDLADNRGDAKEKFKISGKYMGEILQEGIVIIAEVQVENNMLLIYDDARESINENQKVFEKDEFWRFGLYSYYNTDIDILEIVKLN